MATIQDVSMMAGVSAATVSRVINNSGNVNPKTRSRVLEAIDKLDYKPNLLGRNLRRMETRMILVLLPGISNPFYSKVVRGMEDVGHKNGYNVMICSTDSDKEREESYLELVKNKLVDGVIFMAPELERDELSKIGRELPVVECCEYKEGADVPYVSVDNKTAAHDAVKHLVKLGCRRIGMISSGNRYISTTDREAGYRTALEESGIVFERGLLKYGNYGFRSGLRAAKQFLSMDERPDGIFAISDMMAIGAMNEITANGLRIPEDIKVIGFDNINFASMCRPPLTTIAQPQFDLGSTAMELLLKRIRSGKNGSEHIFLEHELIIRESTIR